MAAEQAEFERNFGEIVQVTAVSTAFRRPFAAFSLPFQTSAVHHPSPLALSPPSTVHHGPFTVHHCLPPPFAASHRHSPWSCRRSARRWSGKRCATKETACRYSRQQLRHLFGAARRLKDTDCARLKRWHAGRADSGCIISLVPQAKSTVQLLSGGADGRRCLKSGLLLKQGAAAAVCMAVCHTTARLASTASQHNHETVQDMFITPLCQQYASHTLASRAHGPQPHMRS